MDFMRLSESESTMDYWLTKEFNMRKIYNLIKPDGKMFTGQAKVFEYSNGEIHLISYNTDVAHIDLFGHLHITRGQPESTSTARHINLFAMQHDFNHMTHAEMVELWD